MNRIRLQDVVDSTGAIAIRGASETELIGVSTDTRTLGKGELYLALSGPNFDGNAFAEAAARQGAGALLLRQEDGIDSRELPGDVPVLTHTDPRRALADLGAWYRSTLACPVIGITGSCGKTTTKNVLRDLVSRIRPVVASPSSFNNDIGVPHTLFLADRSTQLIALEMGTNHPGEIAALARIARPTAGIVTNIGASHLEGLGSVEGVAREKGDLLASLPRDGFCVINADCQYSAELAGRTGAQVITFSVEGAGDLDARDLYFHSGGTTLRLSGLIEAEITSPLLGTHNVQNLMAALACCVGLELPLDEVLPGIANLSGGRQRMERIDLPGVTIFDDSYNANPESLRAAVRVLAGLHGFQRRVLVIGDMLELGDLAAELHHAVGCEAAAAGIDRLVLVGELARAAAAGALEGGLAAEHVHHAETTADAGPLLLDLVEEGDVVLVKGSRRMRLEELVQALIEERGPATG